MPARWVSNKTTLDSGQRQDTGSYDIFHMCHVEHIQENIYFEHAKRTAK